MKSKALNKRLIHFAGSGVLTLLLLAALCLSSIARAEAPQLYLTSVDKSYDLAPHANMIKDPGRLLNFASVYQRYKSGITGQRPDNELISLGGQNIPHWMVFEIENKTENKNWILHLGTHLQGQHGLFEEIFVYEHFSKNILVDTLRDTKAPETLYTDISLNIDSQTKALFFVYMIPKKGAITTISPRIVSEKRFEEIRNSLFQGTNLYILVLSLIIGSFIALFFATGFNASLFLAAFYFVQLLFFTHSNMVVYNDSRLADVMGSWYFAISAGIALQAARPILKLSEHRLQNIIIYGLWGLIGISIFLTTGVAPVSETFAMYNIYFIGVLSFVLLLFLSLAQAYIGKRSALVFGMAWLVLIGSIAVTFMVLVGTLSQFSDLAPVYWYSLIPQSAILFFVAQQCTVTLEKPETSRSEKEPAPKKEGGFLDKQTKEVLENQRLKKLIKHERTVMNELRAREIEQREEMRRAKEIADAANRDKSAFLAVVSHEIRTPMTGVMGMVRLLLETNLSSQQQEYAQTIQESGNVMLALLNDILDFEKMESGSLNIEIIDFDLNKLLHGIQTLMSGHASSKGIYLKINKDESVPEFVKGDPVRLRQVLLNLIGNAIKFTDTGGVTLEVSFGSPPTDRDTGYNRLRFSVNDTGVGISAEAQKKLFNPFSQAETSTTRKFGGTGLGLAISQKLVEAMGGEIEIDSEVGKGSSFYFTLELETGSEVEALKYTDQEVRHKPTGKSVKSLKVLIVEDNKINQKLIKEFVDRLGHKTSFADSGEEALDLVKSKSYDMVLMDIRLPGMSGIGATRAIRNLEDKEKARLPIIALSGNVREEDIKECYAANMNGHLSKPVDPKKLEIMIDKVIKGDLDNPVEVDGESTPTDHTVMNKFGKDADKQPNGVQGETFADNIPKPAAREDSVGTDSLIQKGNDERRGENVIRVPDDSANIEAPWSDTPSAPEKSSSQGLLAEEAPDSFDPSSFELGEEDWEEDSFAAAVKHAEQKEKNKAPAPATAGNTPPAAPPLDVSSIESLKEAMPPEDLRSLIEDLNNKADDIISNLKSAIANEDYDEIIDRAHELKGMSGNFGMKEVAGLAEEMEDAAAEKRRDDLHAYHTKISAATEKAKAALRDWLQS